MIDVTREMRHKANRRLARLRGWENIRAHGESGQLVGTRPNTTGDQLIPLWTEDWHACGQLLAELEVGLDFDHLGSIVPEFYGKPLPIAAHANPAAALRFSIVVAAIKKYEAGLEQAA